MTTPSARRLALIDRGFRPIPISGKRPHLSDWTNIDADVATVQSWERDRPRDTNTGILTKDVPVIDVDIRDPATVDKIEALVRARFSDKGKLLRRTGLPPKCAFPFRTEEPFAKLLVGLWAPGESRPKELKDCKHRIEILGSGQQVVVDGIHPDTNLPYEWIGGEPWTVGRDELPLLTGSDAAAFVAEAKELLTSLGWGVFETEDKRNDGGDTKEHDSLIVELAIRLWGEPASCSNRELRFGNHGSKAVDVKTGTWFDFENNVGGGLRDLMHMASSGQPAGQQTSVLLRWYGEAEEAENQRWLLQDLLPEVGSGLISGQSSTFKTFVALDLAGSVMREEPFIEFPTRRRGGVLFVAAEGSDTIGVRLRALVELKYGDTKDVPFAWIDASPRLIDARAVDSLAKTAAEANEKMKRDFGVPLVLIIIDTVAVAAGYEKIGEESDSVSGQRVMSTLANLAKRTRTFVAGVDHFGKSVDTGTRGTSAKEAAADVVLALLGDKSVTGTVSNTRLAIRKRRSGANGTVYAFRHRVVDLGVDQFGSSVTSLVIEWQPGVVAGNQTGDPWKVARSLECLQAFPVQLGSSDQQPVGGKLERPKQPMSRLCRQSFFRDEFNATYAQGKVLGPRMAAEKSAK
jgi:hypothetical protein